MLDDMMTELDQLIAAAYAAEGRQQEVNKVYAALLRATLFLPVQKRAPLPDDDDEPFRPLYAKLDDHYYLAAFDTLPRLTAWAGDQYQEMDYVELTGMALLTGIAEHVLLALNVGSPYYKEFSADEVIHLKKMVARIQQLKG